MYCAVQILNEASLMACTNATHHVATNYFNRTLSWIRLQLRQQVFFANMVPGFVSSWSKFVCQAAHIRYTCHSVTIDIAIQRDMYFVMCLSIAASPVALIWHGLCRTLCPPGINIVQSMLKEATVRDILGTQMADIAFALRVKNSAWLDL